MYSGVGLDRALTQAYRPAFARGGEAVALFIPQTPFIGYPGENGLRRLHRGPTAPEFLGGPQTFLGVRGSEEDVPFLPPQLLPPFYASAAALPDGRFLVTAAMQGGSADYGIYVQEGARPAVLLHDIAGSAELDAVPLVSRPVPPVITDRASGRLLEEAPLSVQEAFDRGGSFVFQEENIHFNAPVDVPIANAPPIGKRLAIEFYMDPQGKSPAGSDPPFLIKSLDVPADGKVRMELPAGVPLFEVLRRPDGSIPLGRDGQIFHVGGMNFGRAGETNRCVGCHAGHSQMAVPQDPSWTNVAPSAVARANGLLPMPDASGQLGPFQAGNLNDRRTGGPGTEWAAASGRDPASFELLWSARLRAREAVLWGIRPGKGSMGERNLAIHGFTLETVLDRQVLQRLEVRTDVRPEGTPVALDPTVEFNLLRVSIQPGDVSGLYEGQKAIALAEVEVIGQAASAPIVNFVRGDADCNFQIDITDAIIILVNRFLGGAPLCCEAAADANSDGNVDISDPVVLLSFLFIGSRAPAAPFPVCGPGEDSRASCDLDVCF